MMKLCLTSALRIFVIVSRKTRLIILGNSQPVIQGYVLRTFLNLSFCHISCIRVSIDPLFDKVPIYFLAFPERRAVLNNEVNGVHGRVSNSL